MSPSATSTSVARGHGHLWRVGLVVAVLAVGGTAWLGWQRQAGRRAAAEAVRLAQQGLFGDSEPRLRAALAYDPENVAVLKALALGLLGSERLDDAEPVLTRWCELEPADAEAYRLRMYQRHRASQQYRTDVERLRLQELALADGRRVLDLDPDDDSAAREVVWLCLAVGRFDEADRVCRRCRERQPDDLWVLYLQARVCHARRADAEAQGLLDTLLARQPQYTRGLLLRASLYREAGEADKAIPLLRQVIDQEPGLRREARYELGLALYRAGRAEEAERLMTELQRSNLEEVAAQAGHTDTPAVRTRRAELLFGAGRAEEALALLQAVLREDPGYADAHRLLAAHYDRHGDRAKADEHRRRAGP
jgi:predicted Zn-dependent protease